MIKQIDDIIESSKLASIAKEKNPKIINGVIGVLMNNDGKLLVYDCVKNFMGHLNDSDYYGYSLVDGGPTFFERTTNFLFGKHKDLLAANFEITAIPTPGSTLAIFLALSLFNRNAKNIVMPNYYWNAYDNMITFFKLKKNKFNYLTDSGFDLESFKTTIRQVASKEKSFYVLLNDPANNPTGYSLSGEEWNSVIAFLNTFIDNKIYLILDIAYLDFKEGNYDDNRNFFLPFLNLAKNIMVCVCYSGSKTFASYGLRIGSLTIFSKNYKGIYKLSKESIAYARSVWSTVPSAGLQMYLNLTASSANIESYTRELLGARCLLEERANLFLKEAKECGLAILPYKAGFFITIKTLSPKKVQTLLIKKGIYTVALNYGIRLAISGISITEIMGLARKIKEVVIK
ncbi:MAG: aminotransferase class I/II-fold pyridoxal phosphate-dependent enzyme [Acholeplasmatales bacterium]|jgi:aspartate/tyrosine/aromatic aminotransferase|nr:aminotransferase class I/II-fold pyridoxal phosphate-dependent enzyme [Acholeplasmatales bacterium]